TIPGRPVAMMPALVIRVKGPVQGEGRAAAMGKVTAEPRRRNHSRDPGPEAWRETGPKSRRSSRPESGKGWRGKPGGKARPKSWSWTDVDGMGMGNKPFGNEAGRRGVRQLAVAGRLYTFEVVVRRLREGTGESQSSESQQGKASGAVSHGSLPWCSKQRVRYRPKQTLGRTDAVWLDLFPPPGGKCRVEPWPQAIAPPPSRGAALWPPAATPAAEVPPREEPLQRFTPQGPPPLPAPSRPEPPAPDASPLLVPRNRPKRRTADARERRPGRFVKRREPHPEAHARRSRPIRPRIAANSWRGTATSASRKITYLAAPPP